jgi:MFS family permease
MMLVAIPAGWLADKKGERLSIALGFGLHFAAMMLFIRASSFWGFAAAWSLLGVGVGFMTPAFSSLTSKAVPEKLRGTAFGLFSTSLGLMSLPAPAIGAQLWQRFSPRTPFAITGWAALLAIIPVWLKFRNGENRDSEHDSKR